MVRDCACGGCLRKVAWSALVCGVGGAWHVHVYMCAERACTNYTHARTHTNSQLDCQDTPKKKSV